MKNKLKIVYCTQCRWLFRASWLAQELLTTFEEELDEVALSPGTGGTFDITLNGDVIFSRAEEERFPESKELKQLVRNQIAIWVTVIGKESRPYRLSSAHHL